MLEIFKNKKANLVQKIENREFDSTDLNEKYKINLNLQNKNKTHIEESQNKYNGKHIPIELITRLQKGEKVVVSKYT